MTASRKGRRWVPAAYYGLAHLTLGAACVVTLWDPGLISGFFYHPKMIAVVHCVTLGWISSSLIAMQYRAAERIGLRAGRLDAWLLLAWAAGSTGLISHFWIEEFSGMVWSAGLTAIAIPLLATRFCMAFAASAAPSAVKLQINFAWLNLVGTGFVGFLLGVDKTTPALPGYSLHNAYAHMHLASIGWIFMLAIALAHLRLADGRADQPAAPLSHAGTGLAQLGAAGIFVSLLTGRPYALPFSLVAACGMVLCAAALAIHARAARPRLPRECAAACLAGSLWLIAAAGIGLSLFGAGEDGADPSWIMVYGVAGLLAGFGPAIAGLNIAWSTGRERALGHWPAVAGWVLCGPLLVIGLGRTQSTAVSAGATALLLAIGWSAWSTLARRQSFPG